MNLKESIASKKFWFSVGAIAVAFVYAVLSAYKLPEMKEMYSTFTGVVEFVAAAYIVGNVGNKLAVGWATKKKKKTQVEPPQKP